MRTGRGLTCVLGGLALMHLSTSLAAPMERIESNKIPNHKQHGGIFDEWAKQRMKDASPHSMEQQQIRAMNKLLERSHLLSMMLALESETPIVAKQLTAVSLMYEMKLVNQSLSQLLAEMKQTNQLMQQFIMLRSDKKSNG